MFAVAAGTHVVDGQDILEGADWTKSNGSRLTFGNSSQHLYYCPSGACQGGMLWYIPAIATALTVLPPQGQLGHSRPHY